MKERKKDENRNSKKAQREGESEMRVDEMKKNNVMIRKLKKKIHCLLQCKKTTTKKNKTNKTNKKKTLKFGKNNEKTISIFGRSGKTQK